MRQRLVRRSPNEIGDLVESIDGGSRDRIQPADGAGNDRHGCAAAGSCRSKLGEEALVGEGTDTDDDQIPSRSENCGAMGLERIVPRHFCNDVGTAFEKIIQGVDDRDATNIATLAGTPDQGADDTQPGPFPEQFDDR